MPWIILNLPGLFSKISCLSCASLECALAYENLYDKLIRHPVVYKIENSACLLNNYQRTLYVQLAKLWQLDTFSQILVTKLIH